MKPTLLSLLLAIGFVNAHSQHALPARNVLETGGTIVKREQGMFRGGAYTSNTEYKTVYVIDTVRHELLNVSFTTVMRGRELTSVYYFVHNKLDQAASGVSNGGAMMYKNVYSYDGEDHEMAEKDLTVRSETDEKYALLKESKKYLAILNRL